MSVAAGSWTFFTNDHCPYDGYEPIAAPDEDVLIGQIRLAPSLCGRAIHPLAFKSPERERD
jgi:hypothetical protein